MFHWTQKVLLGFTYCGSMLFYGKISTGTDVLATTYSCSGQNLPVAPVKNHAKFSNNPLLLTSPAFGSAAHLRVDKLSHRYQILATFLRTAFFEMYLGETAKNAASHGVCISLLRPGLSRRLTPVGTARWKSANKPASRLRFVRVPQM
jgi:hypothetical protein